MTKRTVYLVAVIVLCAVVLHAQQTDETPFAVVERAVKEETGGWTGNKERLSTIFDGERKRLGTQFKGELMKWLGNDVERHYWISAFLENEAYLHGNRRLPELSLLIKEQGITLLAGTDDPQSRRHIVGLNVTAAVLSYELGLAALAASYKTAAEMLIQRDPSLAGQIAELSVAERDRYDKIHSPVSHKLTVVTMGPPRIDTSTRRPLNAPIAGGVLNGKAFRLPKPQYPKAARIAGIQGSVEVRVLIDESGKVVSAEAISGPIELRKASEEAALQSEFAPTKLSGQPVKVTGIVVYNFVTQ